MMFSHDIVWVHKPTQVFSAGSYFGTESLVPGGVYNADIYAQTNLHLLTFNRPDLLHLLEGTDVITRTVRLSQMQQGLAFEAFRLNSIFGRMTEIQKTQLECSLQPIEVQAGDMLWQSGEQANEAFLIAQGVFDAVYGSVQLDGAALMMQQQMSARDLRQDRLGGLAADSPRTTQRRKLRQGRSSYMSFSNQLTQIIVAGTFVGMFDSLISLDGTDSSLRKSPAMSSRRMMRLTSELDAGRNTFTLRARQKGIALRMPRQDFIRFFTNNPGILLSTVGRHYFN